MIKKTLKTTTGSLTVTIPTCLSELKLGQLMIAQVAADGKLTWQDGASIMEWYYQNQFKKID